ncbi:MAG: nucleotidyl transferase AbiEii/AbiGii toxin family protein [Patescibacteria group bacterium]
MVINDQIKQNINQFCFDILPKTTSRAFKKCAEVDLFSRDKWYLADGTALALQIGHRRSVDLDFFTKQKKFSEKKIEELLNEQGKWITTSLSEGTLYGKFLGAKISFIAYPFFTPSMPPYKYGAISIIAPSDIAVMKIIAISQRGRKRDFFDLYWICQRIQPLYKIISNVHKQYSIHQELVHILKALVYFEDAENDPEPQIYFDASWKKVKNFFIKEIPIIAKKIMR